MSRINRVPQGLQSLLDSKNLGNNPSELAETVIPTVDIDKFFTTTLLGREFVGGSGTNIGAGVVVTIPQGEAWQPITFGGRWSAGTIGNRCRLGLEMAFPDPDGLSGGGLVNSLLAYEEAQLAATNNATASGVVFAWPYPVIYGPGTTFTVRVVDIIIVSGVVTLTNLMQFLRYRI